MTAKKKSAEEVAWWAGQGGGVETREFGVGHVKWDMSVQGIRSCTKIDMIPVLISAVADTGGCW